MVEISVLFYVYNAENFLRDSLNSLLNQSFHDFEVICVDDESTDNSLSILEEYSKKDKRFKFISLSHSGFSKSINTIMNLCGGKYLYFMNPDSKLKFHALEIMHQKIQEKNADFLFTNVNFEYNNLYYNKSDSMNLIHKKFGDKILSHVNIGNLIFGIDESLENKFFNFDFIRDNDISFKEDLEFPTTVFFYDALLSAKNVLFLEDFLFEHRKPLDSLKLKDMGLSDVYAVYDSISDLFNEYSMFYDFKDNFLDLKFSLVMKIYSKIKEESKEEYFNEFRKDLINDMIGGNIENQSIMNLSNFNRKIFEQTLISESCYEFDFLRKQTFESIEYNRLMDKKSFLRLVSTHSNMEY